MIETKSREMFLIKPKLLTSSLGIFDFNLLPARYQPKRIRLVAFSPWMLLLVLFAAIYHALILAQEAQTDFNQTRIEVTVLQSSMETYQSAADELTAIQDQIDITTSGETKSWILTRVLICRVPIGAHLSKIVNTVPENITWTTVFQQDQEIVLEGVANIISDILDLQSTLTQLGEFSDVRIDSIEQIVLDPDEIRLIVDYRGWTIRSAPPQRYNFSSIHLSKRRGQ